MAQKKQIYDLIEEVKCAIESEKMAGIDDVFMAEKPKKESKNPEGDTLEALRARVFSCCNCALAETKTNFVFGDGSIKARLMFIGEAPGAEEDKQGLPFVGRAGGLLTKIIEAIGLKRQDVFIANILKCRPPENRNPLPNEIVACLPYLLKQIELIKPKVICALGKFAAQTLLNTETPISKLRGKFYDYNGTRFMPTYHPAYLLRNPAEKKCVWEDMKLVAKELELKIPQR
ncbi:MAG: uracil-DNA glycosylase [Candidatus Omnitrophota bacterium]